MFQDPGNSEIDGTARRNSVSNPTPYRSPETLARDLETALLDKPSGHLGEDHIDRGSLDDAEEALPSVLRMDKGLSIS